jgi:hypothetical protein
MFSKAVGNLRVCPIYKYMIHGIRQYHTSHSIFIITEYQEILLYGIVSSSTNLDMLYRQEFYVSYTCVRDNW